MNQSFFKVSDMIFTWILLWTLFRDIMTSEDIKEGDGYNFHYQVDSKFDYVHFGHNEERRGYHNVDIITTMSTSVITRT